MPKCALTNGDRQGKQAYQRHADRYNIEARASTAARRLARLSFKMNDEKHKNVVSFYCARPFLYDAGDQYWRLAMARLAGKIDGITSIMVINFRRLGMRRLLAEMIP